MAVVLAAGNAAGYASAARAVVRRLPVRPAAAASAGTQLTEDLSGTLPNLRYGQAVGDFLGEGHDQSAYVKDDNLDFAESANNGGAVTKSTATDLKATPNGGLYCGGEEGLSVWNDGGEGASPGDRYFDNGEKYDLTSVKVAASASNIYMAGATWDPNAGNPCQTYKLHLYKLPHDGSCASASCATKTVDLPAIYLNGRENLIVATSLTVGVVGGRTLIAVGMSDEGIYIYDDNLNLVTKLQDMTVTDGGTALQRPVISEGFGPPTSGGEGGVLAAAVETPQDRDFEPVLYSYQLNSDGTEKSMKHSSHWLDLELASTAAYIDGQLDTVFGRADGTMFVMNPDTGDLYTPDTNAGPGLISGLTALTPLDGYPDDQELVVAKQDGSQSDDIVVKYVDRKPTLVPVTPAGETSVTEVRLEQWYPGYGAGRLQVTNDSAGPVTLSMASRPDTGYGCWLNASVLHPAVPAFPVDASAPVAAGQSTPEYFIGAPTLGADGSCAFQQGKDERAAYVSVTPDGDRADEHLVKLRFGDGTLRVADEAGGYLSASVTKSSGNPGAWGSWELKLDGGTVPQAAAAPAVQGARLTSAPKPDWSPPDHAVADDPCRPVYRFDVTGAQWKNVTSAGRVTAQLPAMTAQGSTDDGKTWQDLGQLMPATDPAIAADGTVTLGPASFFFQNPPGTKTAPGVVPAGQASQCPATGDQPVTEVRVVLDTPASGVVGPSTPVSLAGLAAPPVDGGAGAPGIDAEGVQVTPDAPGGTAAPRADGVDQAGLTIKLKPSEGGGIIAPSDPRYKLVYYRVADTNALVTGLYTAGDYAEYVAVQPYASNGNGSAQADKSYLVTTSTAAQSLYGVMNDAGNATAFTGSNFLVAASSSPLTPSAPSATGGISIVGCASSPTGTCRLTDPTDKSPALYQAGSAADGPVTGLQLAVTAITGRTSLPLQVGTANAHQLGSAPLVVTPSQAKLVDTSPFWPSDTIDSALVTSGELVPVLSVPVGSGR